MGERGPASKLRVVKQREGNPGAEVKSKVEGGIMFPPAAPTEPDWDVLIPAVPKRLADLDDDERATRVRAMRARAKARDSWRLWTSVLNGQGLLSVVDDAVMEAAAVHYAWWRECMMALALVPFGTDLRTRVIREMRDHFAGFMAAVRQTGLSPRARDELNTRSPQPSGSDFD